MLLLNAQRLASSDSDLKLEQASGPTNDSWMNLLERGLALPESKKGQCRRFKPNVHLQTSHNLTHSVMKEPQDPAV